MANNISTSFVSQLQVGKRRDKTNYYLDIAEVVAERASCYKTHKGCIIVKEDRVISAGYNGAPRGRQNCMDLGYCVKDNFNIPFDKCYELCRGVHAEMNAINAAARPDTDGATMYLVGVDANTMCYLEGFEPCTICRRSIINAGIRDVYIRTDRNTFIRKVVLDWVANDESLTNPGGYHDND